MSEQVYHQVAVGRQSAVGTSVAATQIFPVEAGFLGFELDRASESPDEDYGSTSREMTGRSSTGVRGATASLAQTMCFQDFQKVLEMHVDTISAPTGSGPYTYAYAYDEAGTILSTALKPYTVEYGVPGSTQNEFEATGCLIGEMTIGFDALSAPGNSPWRADLSLIAVNRAPAAMTGSLAAPATRETMEGHLTTFAEGSTGTAFASLSAVGSSLKAFSLTSNVNPVIRAYGGSSDVGVSIGRNGKGTVSGTAMIAISSTTDTDIIDMFEVSGSVPTERRWRVQCTGSGNNVFTTDLRVVFRAVNIGEHEGERLYSAEFDGVYDATLTSRGKYTLVNDVSAHA